MHYLLDISITNFNKKKKTSILKNVKESFPGKWKATDVSISLIQELYSIDEEMNEFIFNTSFMIWEFNKGYCEVNITLMEVLEPEAFCISENEYQKMAQLEMNEELNEEFKINSSGSNGSIN